MIPPRHRPYFEKEYPSSRDAPTTTKDVSLHSYDVRNSLYNMLPTDNINWGSKSVDKKSLYSDHVIKRRDDRNDSGTDKCKRFEQGSSEKGVFYSPNYPGNYTKNTDCVMTLQGKKLFICCCCCCSAVNV
jgi:hypothetical protein